MESITEKLAGLNEAEKAIIDVYWSDHCRHITFSTPLQLENPPSFLQQALTSYQKQREIVFGDKISTKPITLMDLATISMKEQKKLGRLPNLVDDKSEQNAATIQSDINGELCRISFKNETHNAPTEIMPYDGASTCTGGLLRDLLASRGRPFDGIRVTGAADPTEPKTIPGKLPQKQITTEAARGFSDYMNAIGLTTGHVVEIYHPGYVAKRMELGFGVSVVKSSHVRIEEPVAGDKVILIGEKTGRDGIGGATGSSKQQDEHSMAKEAALVPVGIPETGRKIIELYSDKVFLSLIKRSNDFGAGGISVAVGEIAGSLDIYLDRVPLKDGFENMTPLEIAISESQERMAVVTASADVAKVLELCRKYGLEATVIADVTNTGRLNMFHNGFKVASLERVFLNNHPHPDARSILVRNPDINKNPFEGKKQQGFRHMVLELVGKLENCSQQGLAKKFSQVNANTVLKQYDGVTGKTRTQGTVSLIPIEGNTSMVTISTFGFDPFVAEWSPFHGGKAARLDSLAKIIALGGDYRDVYFTDQEYFATPNTPEKLGAPFAALLGANEVSAAFGRPSVGGKDSMSGSYKDIDVPPTLVSFAIAIANKKNIHSQAFQASGRAIGFIDISYETTVSRQTDYEAIKRKWDYFIEQRNAGNIFSARALGTGGIIGEIINGCLGNNIGFEFLPDATIDKLSNKNYGSLLFEIRENTTLNPEIVRILGRTTADSSIRLGKESVSLKEILEVSESRLETVFPINK